jgi:pilus assembly protein CpaF
MRRALPPASDRVQEAPETPARRVALRTLLERARERGADDGASAATLDRALAEAIDAMKSKDELPAGVEADALVQDARRELTELGPLAALLDDEDVSEVHVMGHDYVVGVRGRKHVPAEVTFSSERAVEAVLARLCKAAGQPLAPNERFVERRLARGARLFVVRPTAADQGHMVVIRKPQRADLTLEDLVRSGTISRAMAGLLQLCVGARANILVTGSLGAGATSLIGALAAAGSTDDRVVVLQEDDEIIFNQPHTISILLGSDASENARAVQAAARIRPDRLVVGAFAGVVAAEMVDAMGDGIDGVLAAAHAPTLRQAVPRLAADLAATRPGVPVDTAREWLASAFDLVVEIARLRDGRHRVMRIAELALDGAHISTRDVFTFTVERTAAGGAVEGAFHSTGVVPGVVEDLAARGATVDLSIFSRHPASR